MTTVFDYLYRDASNYKQWGSVIFAGAITDELRERFARALEGGEFFIADQIRVPTVFPTTWPMYADDHCWHEWAAFESSSLPPNDTLNRTVAQFVIEAEKVRASGWKAFDPQERIGRR